MASLARWITSCFLSCMFPSNPHEMASSPRVIVRNKTFDKRKDKSFNGSFHKNYSSGPTTKCNKRRLNEKPMVNDKNGVRVTKFEESSGSLFSDEDYIVFYFEKDGPFDIVKDDKGVVHKYARPLKVKYGEDADQISNINIHNERSNTNQNDTEQIDQDHRLTPYKEVEGIKDYEIMSTYSRDSIQSEGSTDSFAFPVLDCEGIGTPEQMPKPEDQNHLKKQKDTATFHNFVKKLLHVDATSKQLKRKVPSLKEFETSDNFIKHHDKKAFELFKKVWGNNRRNKAEEHGKANGKAPKRSKKDATIRNSRSPNEGISKTGLRGCQ